MSEQNRNDNPSFLGRGWSFPPQFNRAEGVVRMSQDEDDVRESLLILFGTRLGERVFAARYGLGLRDWLFKPLGTTEVSLLKEQITLGILVHEPRIEILRLNIDTTRISEGQLIISLDYKIRATNSRYNLVYPFYLADGSEVGLPRQPESA